MVQTHVSTITNSFSLAKLLYVYHYVILVYCSLMYIIYKVYQMRRSVAKSLSSLSLGPERKIKCYNGYFVNGYVFHTEEYGHGRKTIKTVFVLRERLVVSQKLTTMVDQKRWSNCNIIASRIECFYSNVIGMTRMTEESELTPT